MTAAIGERLATPLWILFPALAGSALLWYTARLSDHALLIAALAATVLLTAALVWDSPAWGACGLILIVYWNASDVVTDTWGFSWLLRGAIAFTAVAWAFHRLLSAAPETWRWPLLAPLAGYGAIETISAAGAGDRAAALLALFEFAKGVAVFYLVTNLLATPRQWRRGVLAVLGAVVLLSLPVIYQGLTGTQNLLWGFGAMKWAEIVPGQWGWRLGGALGDPNFLALVLVASLPLAAMQALEPGAAWTRRLLGLAALASGLLATLFTYSRASALGIAFVAAMLAVKHRRRRLVWAWMGLLALAALPFVPASWWARVATLTQASPERQQQAVADASIQVRRNELAAGWLMFTSHPLAGVGPGNYESEYYTYSGLAGLTSETGIRDPHSLYVQIASETGLAGIFGFAWLLLAAFRLMARGRARLRRLGAHCFADQIWALELALATYLILSIFLHGAYFRHFLLLLALGALGGALGAESWGGRHARRLGA